MFDMTNLVCRLFAAYVLHSVHPEYSLEGCIWIVNTFYDEVESYQGPRDVYQHAAMKTSLGYSAFFINADRQYQIALDNPTSELGKLLFNAEMKGADTPVPYEIYVRPHVSSTGFVAYKFFKKIAREQYELIPQYAKTVGFGSKYKAERRARELENGGAVNASKS